MLYPLTETLTLRTIDPAADADRCAAHHLDACVASFGEGARYEGRDAYLKWLAPKVDEFPDGFVLAFERGADGREVCVGQLELEVPYGLSTGYISLFYVAPEHRGRGIGRLLHAYAERYFRSWEADRAELHVSPRNIRAIRFYRRLGYAFAPEGNGTYMTRRAKLWKMSRAIGAGTGTETEASSAG
ncbi:MAG TPA: GNAT family N-acetyltransferase [Humisphaera sp.]